MGSTNGWIAVVSGAIGALAGLTCWWLLYSSFVGSTSESAVEAVQTDAFGTLMGVTAAVFVLSGLFGAERAAVRLAIRCESVLPVKSVRSRGIACAPIHLPGAAR